MSGPVVADAATAKHPDAMAPLVGLLDELLEWTVTAARGDLSVRLALSRARVADPRVRLVVVGESGTGMSTLVNGLVGVAVSATQSPVSVPVIAEYGPQPTATLIRSVGNGRTQRQRVDPLDPGPALAAENVIRAEFTEPSPLLAEGFVLMDAPGAPADTPAAWSLIAAGDAVLYVADAGIALTTEQITWLQRIQQVCPTVVCVLNKIDRYPHWMQVQQRNRELLDEAGLGFAVAPISALRHLQTASDPRRDLESGVPQLIEHLRSYVLGRADTVARDAAVRDIRTIVDQLTLTLRSEAETLRDPRRYREIADQLRMLRSEADELRQRTAGWQVTLAEGCAELVGDIEHDLRHRLRTLVREAESEIAERDPARRWSAFGADLDARICAAVEENFVVAHYRSVELAQEVSGKFPGTENDVPLPDLRLGDPSEVLEPVASLEPLDTAKHGATQQFLTALRGSYGGILMVGLATSLLGMSLVNWYSAGAGVLLGVNALWDDRRIRKQRRQVEAKVAVARLMDDVIFQVGKESRNRLRAVQRTLRSHFTDLANQTLRSVDDSLRAAEDAAAGHAPETRARRLTEIESTLVRLREIRETADAL